MRAKIVLIGLDGCGKSTQINSLKASEYSKKFNFTWVRWKPLFLKPIYFLLNRRIKSSNIQQKFYKKNLIKRRIFNNKFIKYIWLFISFVDYFIGFYANLLRFVSSKKGFVFDRYFYDFFIDQGINLGLDKEKIYTLINNFASKIFPTPTVVIYISVKPETCMQRKDDIPDMLYLIKRMEVYDYLSARLNWKVVNGENPRKVVLDEINDIIDARSVCYEK